RELRCGAAEQCRELDVGRHDERPRGDTRQLRQSGGDAAAKDLELRKHVVSAFAVGGKDRARAHGGLLQAGLAQVGADGIGPRAREVVVELDLVRAVVRDLADTHVVTRENERGTVQLVVDKRYERQDVVALGDREPRREARAAAEDAAVGVRGKHGETVALAQARRRLRADRLVETRDRRVDGAFVVAFVTKRAFEAPKHVTYLDRVLARLAAGALDG